MKKSPRIIEILRTAAEIFKLVISIAADIVDDGMLNHSTQVNKSNESQDVSQE